MSTREVSLQCYSPKETMKCWRWFSPCTPLYFLRLFLACAGFNLKDVCKADDVQCNTENSVETVVPSTRAWDQLSGSTRRSYRPGSVFVKAAYFVVLSANRRTANQDEQRLLPDLHRGQDTWIKVCVGFTGLIELLKRCLIKGTEISIKLSSFSLSFFPFVYEVVQGFSSANFNGI